MIVIINIMIVFLTVLLLFLVLVGVVIVAIIIIIIIIIITDYLSWRNTKKGTWFIQAIIYIFRKFAHKEDLFTLMTKVCMVL